MKILTRKEAAEAGKAQYYTGKECKHGHLAPRYTQSGTCSACIRAAGPGPRMDMSRLADSQEVLATAKAELSVLGLRCYHTDLPKVRDVVLAMGRVRFPGLALKDIVASQTPRNSGGGTGFYMFRIHADDYEFLLKVANGFIASHSAAALAESKTRVAAALAAQVAADTCPEPEFKP